MLYFMFSIHYVVHSFQGLNLGAESLSGSDAAIIWPNFISVDDHGEQEDFVPSNYIRRCLISFTPA